MSRPNKARNVTYEVQLARRIQLEREKRDLTYDRLAEKMTEAGCPIQGSAIFKIEKGSPPRRITVNELVTFAQVFGVRVNELLVSAEIAARREVLELFEQWTDLFRERQETVRRLDGALVEVGRKLRKSIGDSEHAELVLRAELASRFGSDSHWVDDMMAMLRDG